MNMQASYPIKRQPTHWDTLNKEYPVRKYSDTVLTSETLARRWRSSPEIIHELFEIMTKSHANEFSALKKGFLEGIKKGIQEIVKEGSRNKTETNLPEEINYSRDYNVTNDLNQSQTTLDYGKKQSDRNRFSKSASCAGSKYIYPPDRKLSERPPACKAHGTTEMKSAYVEPSFPSRVVTQKEQFMHPASLPLDPPPVEPFRKSVEPIDTTYEGFEKYLDPYLTTSRLHHRPFTGNQLSRVSNTKDVMTYYTYSSTPWIRSPKPSIDIWRLPLGRPKSMYDREKFKEDFREIRTHNKLLWTPSAFRTEARDNYKNIQPKPHSQIYDLENEVRCFYKRSVAHLQTNVLEEQISAKSRFRTENSIVGSGKPLSSIIDPFVQRNKRLERK